MNRRLMQIKRSLIVLSLGGSTFALFGANFNPGFGGGCNYATFANYQALFTTVGEEAIQTVSDNTFAQPTADGGDSDFDTLIRIPATTFAQDVWGNYVDDRVPDDLPNNTVPKR